MATPARITRRGLRPSVSAASSGLDTAYPST